MFRSTLQMDIDSETSEALYQKLLQLEGEVRRRLKEKQRDSKLVHCSAGLSWYLVQFQDWMLIPAGPVQSVRPNSAVQVGFKNTKQQSKSFSCYFLGDCKQRDLFCRDLDFFFLFMTKCSTGVWNVKMWKWYNIGAWNVTFASIFLLPQSSIAWMFTDKDLSDDVIHIQWKVRIKWRKRSPTVQSVSLPVWLVIPPSSRQNVEQSDSRPSASSQKLT